MATMCGRCYADDVELFVPNCVEKPEDIPSSVPLGMYHCPDCGAMILAGFPHPLLCQLCLKRQHPEFD